MYFDWLVVGAGFAGSTLAERLASQMDQRVLVIDRRSHIGGNAYDELDASGIRIHRYGPHIFHTNAEAIFRYLSRFTDWRRYEHRVLASVRDQLLPIPINLDTINRLYDLNLTEGELEGWLGARAERNGHPIRTSEDQVVSRVGRELYELFFRGYTRKQWGLDPSQLDASVTARVPTRTNRDDRYFTDAYQAMPREGYTALFQRMLDHQNITIRLETEFEEVRDRIGIGRVVYTGPIDEFFGQQFGPLPYRSLEFRFDTLNRDRFQPVGTVNYPSEDVPHTRITEFKHLTGQWSPRTTIVREFPTDRGDPYYPIPRPENAALYQRYQELAAERPDVVFVGRLATYRYYNMDQVVGQALATFKRIQAGRLEAAEPV